MCYKFKQKLKKENVILFKDKSNNQNDERQFQAQKEQTPPPSRKVSDDVFIAPDTPISNSDENHEHNNEEDGTTIIRQKSRNWADCPIDDSVVDTTPPPSIQNTLPNEDIDDFQV